MIETPLIQIDFRTAREELLCSMGDDAISIGFALGKLSTAKGVGNALDVLALSGKVIEAVQELDFGKMKEVMAEMASDDPAWAHVSDAMEGMLRDVVKFNAMKVEPPAEEKAE